jgi:hypothetical protein
MSIRLQVLKISFIKSVKSSLYCFYRSLFMNLKYLYSRVLNLIYLLVFSADIKLTL